MLFHHHHPRRAPEGASGVPRAGGAVGDGAAGLRRYVHIALYTFISNIDMSHKDTMVHLLEASPEAVPTAMENIGINFSHPRYALATSSRRPALIFSLSTLRRAAVSRRFGVF